MIDELPDRASDEPAVARLHAFGALGDSELAGLSEIAGPERALRRHDELWREGNRLPGLFLLVNGWMASIRDGGDGTRRLFKVHLAGDVLGLPSLAFEAAGETMSALTAATVRPLRLHSFGALFEAYPRLAAMTFMISQQERMELIDRLIDARRDDVTARIATTMILLSRRLEQLDPGSGGAYRLPLTNCDLADLVGISPSRLRSGIRVLRSANLLGWSGDRLTITDAEGLLRLADLPNRTIVEDSHWMPSA